MIFHLPNQFLAIQVCMYRNSHSYHIMVPYSLLAQPYSKCLLRPYISFQKVDLGVIG